MRNTQEQDRSSKVQVVGTPTANSREEWKSTNFRNLDLLFIRLNMPNLAAISTLAGGTAAFFNRGLHTG